LDKIAVLKPDTTSNFSQKLPHTEPEVVKLWIDVKWLVPHVVSFFVLRYRKVHLCPRVRDSSMQEKQPPIVVKRLWKRIAV